MKIATRLHLNTLFFLALIAFLTALLAWSHRVVDREDEKAKLANELRRTAFERIVLQVEERLLASERAAAQGERKTKALLDLLARAAETFSDPRELELLREAQKHLEATMALERPGSPAARDPRAVNQMLVRTYYLIDSLENLRLRAREASTRVRNRAFVLTLLVVLGGGLLIALNSLWTATDIKRRLGDLHGGLARLGRGELDARLPVPGDDELADLARAVNRMAADLQGSLATIEDLNREMTARRLAEEALRVSEENFRRSLDDSPLGVRIVTEEGQTVYANRKVFQIFGCETVEEFRSRPARDRYTPESYNAFLQRRENRRRHRETEGEYEIDIVRKDGEIRRLQVFRKEILWDGRPMYQVLYNDVTEQKRAQEALRLSEERYRHFVAQSSEAIYRFELAHAPLNTTLPEATQIDHLYTHAVVAECNVAFAETHAYGSPEEILNFRIGQFFPRLAKENVAYLRSFIAGGYRVANFESREISRDGTVKHYLNNMTGHVERGFLVRLWCTKRDITRLREAEAALRKKDLTLAYLASQVPGMLYQFRRRPDGTYCLPYSSDGIRCIFGCDPEDVREDFTPVYEAIVPADREMVMESIRASEKGLSPWKCEFRTRFPGVTERWIYANSIPEKGVDGTIDWYGYAVDMTERRRMEEELRRLNLELEERVRERTEALEEAYRELEAFVYSVSHDLRAPLRALEGFSRILLEDHGDAVSGEARRLAEVIRERALNMGRLIDGLLALSRVGRAELRIVPVDMEALVRRAYEEVTTPEDRERIAFCVGSLPPALGDPTLLGQVWVNLLGNAVKFTSHKDRATIEAGWEDGAYFVRDDGAGFDMTYTDKLFGVFQRLHPDRLFPGTGVGLAIVQRIVRRHGGRVWARGEVDRGATFSFTLGGQRTH